LQRPIIQQKNSRCLKCFLRQKGPHNQKPLQLFDNTRGIRVMTDEKTAAKFYMNAEGPEVSN
jgi:hypothetical protein